MHQRRCVPRSEALEVRLAPSTVSVTTPISSPDGPPVDATVDYCRDPATGQIKGVVIVDATS